MAENIDRSYRQEVKIDKFNLDKEWLEQAEKFIAWGEKKVDAEKARDDKKQEVELIKAELSTKIRENPKQFGLEKVTEAAINEVIIQDGVYQSKNREYFDLVSAVKLLAIVVQGFEQRKTALEEEVKLYLNGYWADPRSKGKDAGNFDSSVVKGKIEDSVKNTLRKRRLARD